MPAKVSKAWLEASPPIGGLGWICGYFPSHPSYLPPVSSCFKEVPLDGTVFASEPQAERREIQGFLHWLTLIFTHTTGWFRTQ